MICHEAARAIDPYIDGELGSGEAQQLRDHFESCESCRRRLEQRERLRREIRSIPYRTAPDRLRVKVATMRKPSRVRPLLAWAAMLLAGVALGAMAMRLGVGRSEAIGESPSVVADALVDAHVRALMADHLFDVPSSDQHTVKPWFLGKLDFAPPVTDLSAQGFSLVGGRLDYIAGHACAALVYQRRGHTINLFIWPAATETTDQSHAIRGFNLEQWQRDGMAFHAVSDLNAKELTQFAQALRR